MKLYPQNDKNNCSGCGACVNVCTLGAISMRTDEFGFAYPNIDETKCVSCGKCVRACEYAQNCGLHTPTEAYAASHKNKQTLLNSSSGGVFSALAEYFITHGGAVCGCVYDENLMPAHICTETEDGVLLMRKSKYAQSDLGLVYREVLERLKSGQLVLFTGTPCQVAALYAVVGYKYDNLLTVDLICHGVPSGEMFKKFLEYLEDKYSTKIKHFDFRSKRYKWSRFTAEFTDVKGKTVNIGKVNEFYFAQFSAGNIMRPSCFTCRYACPDRVGDITMGDFWGHSALDLRCDRNNGISVFTCNTERSRDMLDVMSERLILDKIDYSIAVFGNTCLNHPTKKGEKWDLYMQAMKNGEIPKIAKRYRAKNKKKILRGTVKLLLPIWVINYLNKRKFKKKKR